MTTPNTPVPQTAFDYAEVQELSSAPQFVQVEDGRGPFINPAHVSQIISHGATCVVHTIDGGKHQAQMSVRQMVARLTDTVYDPSTDPSAINMDIARGVAPGQVTGAWTPSDDITLSPPVTRTLGEDTLNQ